MRFIIVVLLGMAAGMGQAFCQSGQVSQTVSPPAGWTAEYKKDGHWIRLETMVGSKKVTAYVTSWRRSPAQLEFVMNNTTYFHEYRSHGDLIPSKFDPTLSNDGKRLYKIWALKTKSGPDHKMLGYLCSPTSRTWSVEVIGHTSLFNAPQKSETFRKTHSLARWACDQHARAVDGGRQPVAEKRNRPTAKPKSSTQRSAAKPAASTRKTHSGLARGKPIPGLARIWNVSDWITGINGMESRTFSVMAFDDGRGTTDLKTVLAEGVAASRRKNPQKWFRYRVDGRALKVQTKKGGYRDYYLTIPATPGKTNMTLKGCWTSSSGMYGGALSGGAAVSFSSKTWCFNRDGRFSHDYRSVSSAQTGGGGGTASSSKHGLGSYRIDGNILQIRYDDGRYLRTSFGYYNVSDDETELYIGGRTFRS